ncbi:MAG: ParB/RepB/Spo0J family partition protein [Nitrosotalea sp.]
MSKSIPVGEQKMVKTSEILPNKENPRIIFDPTGMEELKESIRQVGILVPLIVYEDEGKTFLLDGERRWRCAKELGIEEIPVNVIEPKPTRLENLLRMFNIHQMREQWSFVETAWKLEKIIKLSGVDSERRLAELTGITIGNIRRLKIVLSFDKEYQEKVYDYTAKKGKGIKSDFLIEMFPVMRKLEKEFEDIHAKFKYKLMDSFIEKYDRDVIKNVTDFRLFKKVLGNYEGNSSKLEKDLLAFIENVDESILHLYERTSKISYDVNKVVMSSNRLYEDLDDLSKIKGSTNRAELIQTLSKLDKKIRELLKDLE